MEPGGVLGIGGPGMNPLVLPLALVIAAITYGISSAVVSADSLSFGEKIATDYPLEDPLLRIMERVVSGLASGVRLDTLRRVKHAVKAGTDLEGLKRELGPAVVLDFRTLSWGLRAHPDDREAYVVDLSVQSRLIRLADSSVIWSGVCYAPWGDGRRPTPTLAQLTAEGGTLLRRRLDDTATNCADDLLAQLFGQTRGSKPRMDLWTEVKKGPSLDVRVKPATLADVEAMLFGAAGVVAKHQRFDGEFEGMALRAEEAWRLRTLMRDAMDAPWGSDLECSGTIDGAPFKLEMEKHKAGRVRVSFEGLVFDDEPQAREFVAPFVGVEGLRKLELEGFAAARRIRITIGPGGGPEGLVVTDRGAGLPAPRSETVKPDDPLKVRVLPATLPIVREKLLGEQGLVTREQRFDAEFEALALAAKDVEPLVALLRAALRARPRSELELDGTLEGRPFKTKLAVDRQGHGRLELEGFVFASLPEVDRFLARFERTDGLRELTLTGEVAGQKLRRNWQPSRAAPGA